MNKKKMLGALAVVVMASALGSSARAESRADSDLPRFHRLSNVLSYGGVPSMHGIELLHDRHIGTFVDLRSSGPGPSDEKREVERLRMEYLNLSIGNGVPTEQQVSKFVQLLQTSQPKDNMDWFPAVYVHGEQGADAAPALIAIWHVVHDKWDYKRAISDANKLHGGDNPPELKALVKDYADGTKKLQ